MSETKNVEHDLYLLGRIWYLTKSLPKWKRWSFLWLAL